MRNPHLKLHSRAEFTNPTRKQNTHSTPIPHKIKPKGQSPKDNSTCARNAPPTSPNAENLPISPSTGPSTPKAPQAPVHVSPKLPKAQSTQARRVHVIPCSPVELAAQTADTALRDCSSQDTRCAYNECTTPGGTVRWHWEGGMGCDSDERALCDENLLPDENLSPDGTAHVLHAL